MNSFILSIDAGTTGITIYLIQEDGKTLNKYYSEFKQYFPKPGWVEHDAEEIWLVTLNLIQTAFLDFSPKECVFKDFLTGLPKFNILFFEKNCSIPS